MSLKGPTKYLEKLVDKEPLLIHNFINLYSRNKDLKKPLLRSYINY